jgi:hypothetical protein
MHFDKGSVAKLPINRWIRYKPIDSSCIASSSQTFDKKVAACALIWWHCNPARFSAEKPFFMVLGVLKPRRRQNSLRRPLFVFSACSCAFGASRT